ncbi:MAG: hypothetical protein HYU66_25730, partial [Armatimonadetes bacterium]|nr:hypothetical protein [Armatimonadota bacterium]
KSSGVAEKPAQSGGGRTSYTMNSNLVDSGTGVSGSGTWRGLRENRVRYPAQTFLVIEENDAEPIGWGTGKYNGGGFYVPDTGNAAAVPSGWDEPPGKTDVGQRHGTGALSGFVDGHAKWYTFNDLTPYTSTAPGGHNAWYFPRRSGPDTK